MSFSISTTFNQYKTYFYLGIALVFIFLVGSTISLYNLNESKKQTISELKKSNDEKNQMLLKLQEDIKKKVEELERHDKRDFDTIKSLQELNKGQCKVLLVMIDHMIDGNHVEKMKETREQIIEIMANE